MFLHNNPQYSTAADIVKVRKSTKSHVSSSLKRLEEKDFRHAVFDGFSAEEMKACQDTFEKICANAEEALRKI